ncbi:MAG: radical SAM protein [Candidatus Omnitrophota bacterium]
MARILFFQRIWHEFGGPEAISAYLKRHGHNVDLVIGRYASDFLGRIKCNDIIAFSVMTGEHEWALDILSQIKKKTKVLGVFGGPHPTYFSEIINHPAVDVVCRGEGELAMQALADAWGKGTDYSSIPNLVVKLGKRISKNDVHGLVADMDSLPFPDRSIYYKYPLLRKNPMKTFMASRGCPFSCSFCFNEKLRSMYSGKGKYVRFRSPGNLVDEIKEVEHLYGLKSIYFMDDIFVLDKEWIKELTSLYKKEVGKPFVCSASVNTLSEDIIIMLKDANCHSVNFGIETGNEKLRKELFNKNITNEQIKKTASLLKKHKLRFLTFNIIGFPGETVNDAMETVDLNIKIGADFPRCSFLTPYPGTRIAEKYKDKLKMKDIDGRHQQFVISFEVPDANALYNLHCFFQTAVMFPRLIGLIKKLIRLPRNMFFKFWWLAMYFIILIRSEVRNPGQTIITALKTAGPRLRARCPKYTHYEDR